MQNVAYPKDVDRFHDSDLLTKVITFFQDRDERAKRRSVFWYFADDVLGRSRARNQSRRPPGRNERSRKENSVGETTLRFLLPAFYQPSSPAVSPVRPGGN